MSQFDIYIKYINVVMKNGKVALIIYMIQTTLPFIIAIIDVNIKLEYLIQPEIVVLHFHCNH